MTPICSALELIKNGFEDFLKFVSLKFLSLVERLFFGDFDAADVGRMGYTF